MPAVEKRHAQVSGAEAGSAMSSADERVREPKAAARNRGAWRGMTTGHMTGVRRPARGRRRT